MFCHGSTACVHVLKYFTDSLHASNPKLDLTHILSTQPQEHTHTRDKNEGVKSWEEFSCYIHVYQNLNKCSEAKIASILDIN